MSLSLITSEDNFLKSYDVFRKKTEQNELSHQMLQSHLPRLLQNKISERQELNVLSVGSSEGAMDLLILKVIKEELAKRDLGRHVKIFN